MDFTGKVALVSGGGSGIGRSTCELFAERGGALMVVDVNEAAARTTAEAIQKKGRRAVACRCDVTVWEQVQASVERTRRELGRLDILINCAGILRNHLIEETPQSEWDDVLRINLTGAFLLTKAVMPVLRQQGGGSIVHIASRMALRVKEEHAAYAASKAGVMQLTRMAALEGAPHGVRANCVCPGFIDTPMTRLSGPKEDVDAQFAGWNKVCPLGRAGQPEDIARAMLFLASDDAAFITGVALPVDGGRTIL
jgi:NAD(P)-dependent dehydrogenase (short-subunit alcohol dehydrogenase family)